MKLLSIIISFLLTEAEERVLIVVGISDWHVSEASGKTLQNLLLFLFNQKQLHVATNSIVGTLVDTNQIAPFSCTINKLMK